MRLFFAVLGREGLLSWRQGADTLAVGLFVVIAATLFPLALGPEPALLARMAPGLIWACALLACLLPLDRLFGADAEDGSLDQLRLCGLPEAGLAAAKALSLWLAAGLPIVAIAAPVALMLHAPLRVLPVLVGGLALGTAALALLGTACAAIALGARRDAVLMPLLMLPLSIPVLIFGASAADAAAFGLSPAPHLLLLAAMTALLAIVAPLAAGAALRQG